jgi:hypothetical protein
MINIDAAIFEDSNRMSLDVVIRNHNGDFIAAASQGIENITNPELVETFAFRHRAIGHSTFI